MPPIRNSSVARGVVPNGQTLTIYTVPAANVLLLKDIRFSLVTAGTPSVYLSLHTAGNAIVLSLLFGYTFTGNAADWSGWLAMNEGDYIQLGVTGVDLAYWISGATLPFVPGF